MDTRVRRVLLLGACWIPAAVAAGVVAWLLLPPANRDAVAPVAITMGFPVAWVLADAVHQRSLAASARSRWGASASAWLTGFAMFLLLGIVWPAYYDMTIRYRVVDMILAARPARDEIAGRMRANPGGGGAGSGTSVPRHRMIAQASIDADGTIRMRGDTEGVGADVSLRISPRFDAAANEVVWTCMGEPARYMPATCR